MMAMLGARIRLDGVCSGNISIVVLEDSGFNQHWSISLQSHLNSNLPSKWQVGISSLMA
jgi:hypothetical protein